MTTTADWQGRVGETWAAEWRRTDRAFTSIGSLLVDAAVDLLDRAPRDKPRVGDALQLLDVGCGAGSLSLSLAERLDNAHVLGIDLSPDLIDVARERAAEVSRCRFAVADAARWQDPAWRPDLIVSRHGVMFFDDPIAAFAHLRGRAAPGAKLVFSCFRSRSENSWTQAFAPLLPDGPASPDDAPGPFAFANLNRVSAILNAAGWRDVVGHAHKVPFVTGGGTDPEADALAFHTRIGSTASALASFEDDAERAAFTDAMREVIAAHRFDQEVRFNAAIWIISARANA